MAVNVVNDPKQIGKFGEADTEIVGVTLALIKKLEPLFAPITFGFELSTRTRYWFPVGVLQGITAAIEPLFAVLFKVPIATALVKLPNASDKYAV